MFEHNQLTCNQCTKYSTKENCESLHRNFNLCDECFINPKLKRCHNVHKDYQCLGLTLKSFCNDCRKTFRMKDLNRTRKLLSGYFELDGDNKFEK
jgi:hypothetical protein